MSAMLECMVAATLLSIVLVGGTGTVKPQELCTGTDSARRCSGGALAPSRTFSGRPGWRAGAEMGHGAAALSSLTRTGARSSTALGSGGLSGPGTTPGTY